MQPSSCQASSQEITKKSGSNLALAFILLPPPKRQAMVSLYAFCRLVDDIADEETTPVEERRAELNRWRDGLQRICAGGEAGIPLLDEFAPVVRLYEIPYTLMNELILGVEMDLESVEYHTWEELDLYCYRVASVVGLMSLRVFGATQPASEEYALALGRALQYTNILRDVKVDLTKGRIYLPSEEFEKFGVKREDLLANRYTEAYRQFAEHYKERTVGYYRRAREVLPAVDRPQMIAAELMGSVYWQLLQKLIRAQYNVFEAKPVRLSKWEKIVRILQAWAKFKLGFTSPLYGVLK